MFCREHYDIESGKRSATHGIDVGDGICRRYLAEPVRIVNWRRDEIHGIDHGNFIRQPVDRGVIGGLKANKQVWISRWFEPLQSVRQDRRTDFGSSTAGTGQASKRFFLEKSHAIAPAKTLWFPCSASRQ